MTLTRSHFLKLESQVNIRGTWLGVLLSRTAKLGNPLFEEDGWTDAFYGRMAYLSLAARGSGDVEAAKAWLKSFSIFACIVECQMFRLFQRDDARNPRPFLLLLEGMVRVLSEQDEAEHGAALKRLASFNPLGMKPGDFKLWFARQDARMHAFGVSRSELQFLRSRFRKNNRTVRDEGRLATQRARRTGPEDHRIPSDFFLSSEIRKALSEANSVRDPATGRVSDERVMVAFFLQNDATS